MINPQAIYLRTLLSKAGSFLQTIWDRIQRLASFLFGKPLYPVKSTYQKTVCTQIWNSLCNIENAESIPYMHHPSVLDKKYGDVAWICSRYLKGRNVGPRQRRWLQGLQKHALDAQRTSAESAEEAAYRTAIIEQENRERWREHERWFWKNMEMENAKKAAAAKAAEARWRRAAGDGDFDADLAHKLRSVLQEVTMPAGNHSPGFVYFKCWSLPSITWYKVGVTNDPQRRDSEQNILPVPAITLLIILAGSMRHAYAIESAVHRVLNECRIRGANNRELFQLEAEQATSVRLVLEEQYKRVF